MVKKIERCLSVFKSKFFVYLKLLAKSFAFLKAGVVDRGAARNEVARCLLVASSLVQIRRLTCLDDVVKPLEKRRL